METDGQAPGILSSSHFLFVFVFVPSKDSHMKSKGESPAKDVSDNPLYLNVIGSINYGPIFHVQFRYGFHNH